MQYHIDTQFVQNGNNSVVAVDSINIDLDKYLEGVGASASARTNPVPRAMVAAVAAQPFFVPLELPPQPPLRGRGHNLIVPPRRQIRRQNKR